MANTRQSNAYMLMYRLYDPKEDKKSLSIHEDCIPDSIKYDVELMEQKQVQVRVDKEERS